MKRQSKAAGLACLAATVVACSRAPKVKEGTICYVERVEHAGVTLGTPDQPVPYGIPDCIEFLGGDLVSFHAQTGSDTAVGFAGRIRGSSIVEEEAGIPIIKHLPPLALSGTSTITFSRAGLRDELGIETEASKDDGCVAVVWCSLPRVRGEGCGGVILLEQSGIPKMP